jgi:hypothetical protein
MLVAIPAAAAALAGCGGGDGGDDTVESVPVTTTEAPPTLTKEELISQGDAICAEVNAAVGGLETEETEVAERAEQTAELYGGMVDRLQALGEPEDPEGYAELTAAADDLTQAQSDVLLAAERGEEEGLLAAEAEAATALDDFQEAAAGYGFEDCAEAPSAPLSTEPGEVPEEVEEAAPEEVAPEEVAPEEVAPEEVAPETGGAGGTGEGGGTGTPAPEGGGGAGGIGPG